MKKWIVLILILFVFSFKSNAQTFTQIFVDKCTGESKVATIQYVNGNAVVSFYNQIRVFTPIEVRGGVMQAWLLGVYNTYANLSCATNPTVQQTVQQATQQATQQAASQAASSSASSAASSAVSNVPIPPPPPAPTTSPTPTGGSSSSSSTTSGGSSSSETKTETKTSETKTEEKKSETKTEEKKEETKSEESSEESSSEESSEESSSEESSEESKEEKKEEKKKQQNLNPLLLASDLTTAQNLDGTYSVIVNSGVSRSSMAGDESYGANVMVWSTLDQYAVSSNYTKMDFKDGVLKGVHSYGVTVGYLKGAWMLLKSYTYVKPDPKIGTYGFNLGGVTLLTKGIENKRSVNISSSFVVFWTKPYQYSKKLTLSPQIFVMSSPISYTPSVGYTNINRSLGFLIGSSFDYKISKRFGFTMNYKANITTTEGIPLLHNFLVGSRMIL